MIDVIAIDDDSSICWLLREVLALAGVSHRVTSCVAEAMDFIIQDCPAVAIIDISLAGVNGIDVARQVSAMSPQTEIIFLTGYGNGVKARAGIPCAVIEKPFDIDHLITVVLEHIATAKARAAEATTP